MYKSLPLLLFLLLCAPSLTLVRGQAPGNKTQPLSKSTGPNNPLSAAPGAMPPASEAKAEAERFYKEGLRVFEAGEFSRAIENFKQAVRLNPEYADAHSALGRTYFKLRQWQKSIDSFRRASELHAKPQATQPVRPRQVSPQNNENTSAAVKDLKLQSKPTQTTNAHSASVQPLRPAPPTSRPTEPPKAASANSNAQSKQPTSTATEAKTVRSEPPATRPPEKVVVVKKNAPVPQIKRLSATSFATVNAKQAAHTAGNGSEQPKPLGVRVSLNVIPPAPKLQDKRPQTTNAHSATVQPQRTVPTTTPLTAPAKAASANSNPQSKQPPATATEAKTVRSEPPATRPPEKAVVVKKNAPVPQVKRLGAMSSAGVNSNQTANSEPTLQTAGNGSEQQNPVGVRVSLTVTPPAISEETKPVAPVATTASTADALTNIYRVGPSDVLDIRLNDSQSPKSTLFTVTPAGLLEHPMLIEPLPVSGLTVEEIGTKIGDELIKRALIENPKVAVGVRDYASHSILVSGLVRDPGTKFLRREAIPLYVVVADAQPLPEAAKVTLVRDGMRQVYEVDLTQVTEMNLLVRSGDVITVNANEIQFVYIDGEVKFPGEKTFRRGLTLTQAIMTAGLNPKAKVAQIGRDNGEGFVVQLRFNLEEIASGKAADPLLKPGDRIMILR